MKRLVKKASSHTFYYGTNVNTLRGILSNGAIECKTDGTEIDGLVVNLSTYEELAFNYSGTEAEMFNGGLNIPVMIEVQLTNEDIEKAYPNKPGYLEIDNYSTLEYPFEIPISKFSKVTIYYNEIYKYEMTSFTLESLDVIVDEIEELYEEDNE